MTTAFLYFVAAFASGVLGFSLYLVLSAKETEELFTKRVLLCTLFLSPLVVIAFVRVIS